MKMKLIPISLLILFLTGCATFVVKDGQGNIIEQGEASGFGRDLTHTKTTVSTTLIVQGLPVTTTTTTDSITSTSNVANTMNAANGILGTLIDGAGKMSGAIK